MVKAELIKRSPLRILEKSIHGALKPGHFGVIASEKGVGKTACLVHLATDKLIQGKLVIHISFETKSGHIINWYETVFAEIAKKRGLDSVSQIHDEIVKNRVIFTFHQDTCTTEQVIRSLKAPMDEGGFAADLIVIDGFDYSRGSLEVISGVLDFAKAHNLVVWSTADVSAAGTNTLRDLSPIIDKVSVLIDLEPKGSNIKLSLRKDYDQNLNEDLHLVLESRSMLIVEE